MEIPRYWREQGFRYRLVVNKELMENNPFVGMAHHNSSKEEIEAVHENLLQGEIDVKEAMSEAEASYQK